MTGGWLYASHIAIISCRRPDSSVYIRVEQLDVDPAKDQSHSIAAAQIVSSLSFGEDVPIAVTTIIPASRAEYPIIERRNPSYRIDAFQGTVWNA